MDTCVAVCGRPQPNNDSGTVHWGRLYSALIFIGGISLKLRRQSLQTGFDFAHEVQRASHADHIRRLRLTARLR